MIDVRYMVMVRLVERPEPKTLEQPLPPLDLPSEHPAYEPVLEFAGYRSPPRETTHEGDADATSEVH